MTEYETPHDDYTRWLEERGRAMTAHIGELEERVKQAEGGPRAFVLNSILHASLPRGCPLSHVVLMRG
jgi:hypothetical protein